MQVKLAVSHLMNLILVLVAGASLATSCQASGDSSGNLGDSGGFGLAAGEISGSGLAYRQFFENGWGGQVAGFLWSSSSIFFGNFGVNAFYTVHRNATMRFYIPVGVGLYRTVNNTTSSSTTATFLGLGYGMMFDIGKSFSLALDLPLCLRINSANGSTSYGGILPVPGLALLYEF